MTPEEAARQFEGVGGGPATRLAGGHIHETWRIGTGWVLQRCNQVVFPDLDAVMSNIGMVPGEVRPVRTHGGGVLWDDGEGGRWRAWPFVSGTRPATGTDDPAVLGRGLARFHRSVAAVDPAGLTVTIPHFHDPARRLARLHEMGADIGESLHALPPLPTRVAHFDAKASNFLIDTATGEVRAVIDLDTVMPGAWAWDVGDLVRSAATTGDEDDVSSTFDVSRFTALVGAYLDEVGDLLEPAEVQALGVAPLAVTFEQAVRFLTDHLQGDVYYRVDHPGHNKTRADAQLHLLRSMLGQRDAMMLR